MIDNLKIQREEEEEKKKLLKVKKLSVSMHKVEMRLTCIYVVVYDRVTLRPRSHERRHAIYCSKFSFTTIIFWGVTANFWKLL